jgi:hypothetical protein
MNQILSTYEKHRDDVYKAMNKNPDAVYYFKDGILFLILHSEHSSNRKYGFTKVPLSEYFDDWYNTVNGMIDYICTSSVVSQFGGVHKYTTYDFDSLVELESFLKEKYMTHNITISYFDCLKHNDVQDIIQYRIVANLFETKQKTRKVKLEDLLS